MPSCFYPRKINDIIVPCGKCKACRIEYVNNWARRAHNEFKTQKQNAVFVTLTYSDDYLPKDFSLRSSDFKKFIKSMRKKVYPRKIKYFGCGEYGEQFGRPHYHCILYNCGLLDALLIRKIWKKGHVKVEPCTNGSFRYIAKYALKTKVEKQKYENLGLEPEGCYFSKGIGLDYIESNRERLENDLFQVYKGKRVPLTSYEYRILNYSRDLNKDKSNRMRNHLTSRRRILSETGSLNNLNDNDFRKYGGNMEVIRILKMKDSAARLLSQFKLKK